MAETKAVVDRVAELKKDEQTRSYALSRNVAFVPANSPNSYEQAQQTYGPGAQPAQGQSDFLISLPQAPYDAATGRAGGLKKLAIHTVLRAGLIGLGCYVAGVRGTKPLVLGSLAASSTLSGLLMVHHAYRAKRSW